jgi:D-alanyl-lipoteichoic acid acyltransferase DltB (MBOAT superfamily)
MLVTAITFLIAGLWHGASWMFVIFGGLHGLGLITNHYWKKRKVRINKFLAWFITFNFVNITFIFFRAKDWDDAVKVLSGMITLDIPMAFDATQLIYIGLFFIMILFKNSNEIIKLKLSKNVILSITSFLLVVSMLQLTNIFIRTDKVSEFLYFNF